MKAVQKFRALLDNKRPVALSGVLGKGIRTLHPSENMDGQTEPALHKSRSTDLDDRRKVETALAAEGAHHDIQHPDDLQRAMANRMDSSVTMTDAPIDSQEHGTPHQHGHKLSSDELPDHPAAHRQESGEKGHAHDPLDEEPLFLGIGTGIQDSLEEPPEDIVAESPTAAEFSIYNTAYQQEVDRIRAAQGKTATVYLTRRVDAEKEYKADENMVNAPDASQVKDSLPHQGFKGLLDKAREKGAEPEMAAKEGLGTTSNIFSAIAAKAVENTRVVGKEIGDKSGWTLGSVWQKATERRKERSERKGT
jgi:[calcium/calmodulin-dependent protein kinase] kinase